MYIKPIFEVLTCFLSDAGGGWTEAFDEPSPTASDSPIDNIIRNIKIEHFLFSYDISISIYLY